MVDPSLPKSRVLFARHGVQLDRLGRDEVTPEVFARFTAELLLWANAATTCRSHLLEVCSGLGGNTIQFALLNAHVTAVEVDGSRILKAQKNAHVYNVPDSAVTWLEEDFMDVTIASSPVDAVFMSPPWGGKAQMASFKLIEKPLIVDLFRHAWSFSDVVAIYLPKSVTVEELLELPADRFDQLQVERLLYNGKSKALVAIYRRGQGLLPSVSSIPLVLRRSPASDLLWRSLNFNGWLERLAGTLRTRLRYIQ